MKKLILAFTITLSSLLIISCSDSDDEIVINNDPIVGEWLLESISVEGNLTTLPTEQRRILEFERDYDGESKIQNNQTSLELDFRWQNLGNNTYELNYVAEIPNEQFKASFQDNFQIFYYYETNETNSGNYKIYRKIDQ